jgi:hypothetical protein
MAPARIDAVARISARGMTRREALCGLLTGAGAVAAREELVHVENAKAGRRRLKNNNNVCDG